jgi:hypothetical protein
MAEQEMESAGACAMRSGYRKAMTPPRSSGALSPILQPSFWPFLPLVARVRTRGLSADCRASNPCVLDGSGGVPQHAEPNPPRHSDYLAGRALVGGPLRRRLFCTGGFPAVLRARAPGTGASGPVAASAMCALRRRSSNHLSRSVGR